MKPLSSEKEKRLSPERTIAILGIGFEFTMPVRFFQTIRELTRQHHYQILYFTGEGYKCSNDFRDQANLLYSLITPRIVDGLILMSNLIGNNIPQGEFLARCLKFRPIPMVSLGMSLTGIPSVVLDNFTGMFEAVCHLIEVHHLTRIAFLSGPRKHSDMKDRYSAYIQALETHGLVAEQGLLLEGDFTNESGKAAVREVLDIRGKKPGKDIQAIVCCNDFMASGVVLELQQRGIRIPGEITVLGFDDMDFAESLTPPLSTVCQPFEMMAAKAIESMLGLLNGKEVPDIIKVPSRFIPRRSCGCFYSIIKDENVIMDEKLEKLFLKDPRQFLEKLNPQILMAGAEKLFYWNRTISLLRDRYREQNIFTQNNPPPETSPDPFLIIGRTAFAAFSEVDMQYVLYSIWSDMTSTLELPVLLSILTKRLPQIGVNRCYICIYEKPEDFPGKLPPRARLILAFSSSGREELPAGGLRFSTKKLIPEQIVEKHGWQSGVVLALYFHREQIGYAVLDHELRHEYMYWSLRKHISGALKGTLLLIDLREHSLKLAEANATIREFNEQLKSENLRIKAEMEVAKNIQAVLLPGEIRDIHHDFEITASMLPAEQVGGDYYDVVLDREGALWLGIGDVSGHGLIPGLIMMLAQTVHTCITTNYSASPAEALCMINRVMIKNIQNRMQEDHYMTCTLLKYRGDGVFQYAGMHLDLIIYRRASGSCERIETQGGWLNIVKDIDVFTHNLDLKLETGDILVLYSDGIIESTNSAGQMLEMQRFIDLILRHKTENIDKMRDAILADVLAWNNDYYKDDITLLLARRVR